MIIVAAAASQGNTLWQVLEVRCQVEDQGLHRDKDARVLQNEVFEEFSTLLLCELETAEDDKLMSQQHLGQEGTLAAV